MSLDLLADSLHDTAVEKGFWNYDIDVNFVLAKLALVHSEVSEVLEAVRKQKGDAAVLDEMSDIIIRLLDLYAGMKEFGWLSSDVSLDSALELKAGVNQTRPKMHGNLI